jgi:hypothetical protein
MPSKLIGRRMPGLVVGLATLCAGAVLGAGAIEQLWLRPAADRGWQALLAGAILAVMAVLGTAWQCRARATRQWNDSLDAYAEREIARAQSRNNSRAAS